MNQSKSTNTLSALQVLDCIEVGPVRVEKHRFFMPVKTVRGRHCESFDLICSYHEDVFDPKAAESINLASFAGAQAVLNYALFAKKIVFRGLYDAHDMRFLREMADVAAHEILVNKILQPNKFLYGKAIGIKPFKAKNYLLSKFVFESQEFKGTQAKDKFAWQSNPDIYAVSSSGGKDSLLSFGLLNEIGVETHPIFLNESGHHWTTALNSFRDFEKNFPLTTRVWLNTDRFYTWMHRQIPIIRPDFDKIRSDGYPIPLYVLPPFICGLLPLLRKRKVGKLVIGNEYDSSTIEAFHSIRHYHGLYDQSIFFDTAFSAYMKKKKWGLEQLSIIRQLSELLIEKTLIERYSGLQKQQVSCHNAMVRSGKVRPCGNCEKCARILSMLLALGQSPLNCGYNRKTIKSSLDFYRKDKVCLEPACMEHVAWELDRKKIIASCEKSTIQPAEHPEALSLRIHPVIAPKDLLPLNIRKKFNKILLSHARGAVEWKAGKWQKYKPMT